jgi:hypothetical protein
MRISELRRQIVSEYNHCFPDVFKLLDMPDHTNRNAVCVRTGKLRTGDHLKPFLSWGFYGCSGYLFKAPHENLFGFLHALPWQKITAELENDLIKFQGGTAIGIKGTLSAPKPMLWSFLQELNIYTLKTLEIETCPVTKERRTHEDEYAFDLAYEPRDDAIVVARELYQDKLYFPGFSRRPTRASIPFYR